MQNDRFHWLAKEPNSWRAFSMQYDRHRRWAKSQTGGAHLVCNMTISMGGQKSQTVGAHLVCNMTVTTGGQKIQKVVAHRRI
jgi:hypothetical protein